MKILGFARIELLRWLLPLSSLMACGGNEAPVGVSNSDGDSKDPAMQDSGPDATNPAAGWVGDGTLDTVDLVEVYDAPDDFFCTRAGCRPGLAVDLEFNPARPGELWVLYRQPYSGELCEETNKTSLGCQLMASRVVVISDADTDHSSAVIKDDGNAWHFMRVATALAFADDDTFATVGEVRTGNFMDDPLDFMGPTWWSADPEIFGIDFGLNGSHLDMLHATPFGMGIAHDPTRFVDTAGTGTRPVFWAFNGAEGAIDRYDFKLPHEPGGKDHSDGTLHRYVWGELLMEAGVPSHMEFGSLGRVPAPSGGLFGEVAQDDDGMVDDWRLFASDTGHQRVVSIDPAKGRLGAGFRTADDQLVDPREVVEVSLQVVVPTGVMQSPSGLAIAGDLLFVGDVETGKVHVFQLDGTPLTVFDTELPVGALAGLAIGPDERLYIADWNEGRVLRVEPEGAR